MVIVLQCSAGQGGGEERLGEIIGNDCLEVRESMVPGDDG